MQVVNYYKQHAKIFNTILLIIVSPLILTVITMLAQTILNLGSYLGTFLRYLYEIVVFK